MNASRSSSCWKVVLLISCWFFAAAVAAPQAAAQTQVLSPSTTVLTYAKQIAGTSSATQAVVVTNISAALTVQVSSLSFDSATPGFTETDNCVPAIAPGASCTISIAFAPTTANLCTQIPTLTINDDDPGGPLSITLFGEGAAAGGLTTTDLTSQTLTPAALAQSLVGSGVTISNVTYTGAPVAAGTFSNGTSIIGFDKGVILSDGAISNVLGPNCDTGISQENNEPGDQDLTNLICTDTTSCAPGSGTTNDAAVLEFDFVPTSTLLTFQYVFASDEYPEFVFDFNDVFAFFLNQNGSPKKDIALIPGTNTIVSINNVNNGSTDPTKANIPPVNPQFYLDNNFQFPTVAPLNTEMDGLTTVLSVQAPVNPGQTYHIKLAIADALDFALDSNVFIKSGSLSSTNLSIVPPALGFGNGKAGSTSAAQTVTITNVGSTPISNLAVAASASFTQTNTCPTTLAPNASCVITVKFVPTTNGPVNGTITITDSAPDSPQTITMGGTGVTGAFVSISPFSLTFAPVPVGTSAPPQTLTVTNTGAGALTITSITSSSADFTETDTCQDSTIQPAGTCSITVTFTPSVTTVETAFLILADNAQSNGAQNISLTGNATNTITITPPSLAFGNQAIDTTSAPQTVTFTNTGTVAVSVPSVVVGSGFAETNTCNAAPVAAGGSCTASVTFTPTTATAFTTNLTFTDTAPNSPQNVGLTGTGTAAGATITITPPSLTFTGQAMGTSSPAQNIVVTNPGTSTVTFTAIATSGDFSGATLAQCPTLAGGASCTFPIVFTPTATGTRTGAVTFTDNAAGSPQSAGLTGTGTGVNGTLTITEGGTGTGTVTSAPAGINCPTTCTGNFASGTQIVLTATPTNGSTFAGWGAGPCEGTGTCTLTITVATTVVANFTASANNFTLAVTEAGTGSGTVTSAPAGIICPETCSAGFASGTQVTLTQSASEGSVFAGWSGACTGTAACVVTMTAAKAVTATFNSSNNAVTITVPSGGSTTATTTPGGTTFFGLIITCAPGQTGTVTLTATSSSNLISVNLIPNTVVCPGGAQQAVKLQTFCQGSAVATGLSIPGGLGGGGIGLILATMLGGFGFVFRRERRVAVAFAMVLILVTMGIGACASLPKSPTGQATPPGTYFISLTTTLNGQVQTLPNFLTLVVK